MVLSQYGAVTGAGSKSDAPYASLSNYRLSRMNALRIVHKHRNGLRLYLLTAPVGTITLRLPRLRNGNFSTKFFARYQHI